MDMVKLESELLEDLSSELLIKEDDSDSLKQLQLKIKNAIREVKRARNYPKSYADDVIAEDLNCYYSNIHDLALYDYNQIGAEGQSSHSENGTSRNWKSRSDCLIGVVSMCKVF